MTQVVRLEPICPEHYRLTLRCDDFPPSEPGQFIQIQCTDPCCQPRDDREYDWKEGQTLRIEIGEFSRPQAFLRRPFSLAGRRETQNGVEIQIIGRDVGIGTHWMSQLQTGQKVSVIGPLGNAFELPPPGGIALMVGGGVGIPPMIYLAEKLSRELADPSVHNPRKGVAFCGATTRDLLALTVTPDAPAPDKTSIAPLYNIREFQKYNVPAVITTDDGSYGFKGYVTEAFERYLDRWITDQADRQKTVIYTCGPEGMMKTVAQIAIRRNIACQVCVERAMACGMGTCQSCCIRVKKDDPSSVPLKGSDWCYRLACTDGPVFQAEKLLW
jgi:dihydroorotate dehydrogenase electron transfer subunit